MFQQVEVIATIWMTVLLAAIVVFAMRARSNAVRLLAIDALTLVLVAMLVLFSAATGQPYFIDAAIALALMSFIGTVVGARRIGAERVL